jgi:hypothetical protein
VLPSPGITADLETLMGWWERQQIDVSFLPTPMAEFAFNRGIDNPHLRTLLVGGDQLLRQPDGSKKYQLINNYGLTETTVVATSGYIEASEKPAHIGRPISNTQIYILDTHYQPAPIGVVGELYVGGASVARGYLNRRELTAERFVVDPFRSDPQARMYKTGDLGRWRADGSIEYLGRNDNQVKIRGYRIELGEIEAHLTCHEQVREAVVVAREDMPGEKRLVAYVTLKRQTSANELRAFLRARLPEYMTPVSYEVLESLPLTPNGKTDRKALLLRDAGDQDTGTTFTPPSTAAESVIAGIWAALLRREQVGIHDNFFEIGGHSLLSIQLASRARDIFQVSLSIKQIYESPTVAGIVEELADLCGGRDDVEEIAAVYMSMAALSDEEVRAALAQGENGSDESMEYLQLPGGLPVVEDRGMTRE